MPKRKKGQSGYMLSLLCAVAVFVLVAAFLYQYVFADTSAAQVSAKPTAGTSTSATPTPSGNGNDNNGVTNTGKMVIHFVDVGQGDCSIIEFPDGKHMIIDAGSGTNASAATIKKVTDYVTQLGITHFDWVMLTHPDADHCNILDDVIRMKDVSVGKIFMPAIKSTSEKDPIKDNGSYEVTTATYRTFVDAAVTSGADIEYTYLTMPGDTMFSSARYYAMEFSLMPSSYSTAPSGPLYGSVTGQKTNSVSPIMAITYAGKRVMFTGDSNEINEPRFVSYVKGNVFLEAEVKSDVLKVAHHGSREGSSQDFIALISPIYAIVSVGEGNTYGHPTADAINRIKASINFARMWRTDQDGTVTVTFSAEITVKSEKGASVNMALFDAVFAFYILKR